jgi:hypothetical protein
MREIETGVRIATVRQRYPFRRAEHAARVDEGLRLAGMPE